ncbi:hypothetical protein QA421_000920 [Cronobacter sakazakii]|uniref:hypothetical protein n=1 Tax=Cronobacter sakazakii TaxID=28141 RepID=UPI001AA151B1|nr:hypothetical protein [Cronobacter sakazakii]EKS1107493.1 hypothetical protein [Cronobacter sakazakii]EKY2041105.1 hypothetical protein [Cronobacter sakazakii]EKY3283204.1 hypothetical protein [Cronobacter sakazakii]ELQ6200174.1 hypothetical protein [Cronobacter sakazakii]ELY3463569.1 hypothetical protein [Cronobacter sakazakii]
MTERKKQSVYAACRRFTTDHAALKPNNSAVSTSSRFLIVSQITHRRGLLPGKPNVKKVKNYYLSMECLLFSTLLNK